MAACHHHPRYPGRVPFSRSTLGPDRDHKPRKWATRAFQRRVLIYAKARSSQGISRVELYINGELTATQLPARGNPRDLIAELPFAPLTEGSVIVSVLAVDRKGTVSDPFSITLNVVSSIEDIEISSTPTPTPSAEEFAQTQTAQAICTNSASFVTHVTIPESTQISTNVNFTKIWRVNNNGSCDWIGYQLVHSGATTWELSFQKPCPSLRLGRMRILLSK